MEFQVLAGGELLCLMVDVGLAFAVEMRQVLSF